MKMGPIVSGMLTKNHAFYYDVLYIKIIKLDFKKKKKEEII